MDSYIHIQRLLLKDDVIIIIRRKFIGSLCPIVMIVLGFTFETRANFARKREQIKFITTFIFFSSCSRSNSCFFH